MISQNKFRVGGWLYFCDPDLDSDLQSWWEVVKIEHNKYNLGDAEMNIPPGYYTEVGIDYAGTIYWYPEYRFYPVGSIKYVDTPEEKLFLQLAQKNL